MRRNYACQGHLKKPHQHQSAVKANLLRFQRLSWAHQKIPMQLIPITQRLMTLHSLRQESCGNLFRFSWKSPRMKQGRMTKRRSEKKWTKIVYLYVKQLYLRVVTNYSNLWNFPRKKESIAHLMMIWWCWWLCIKMLHQLKKLKERNSQTLCFSIPSKNATSNPFTLQKTFKLAN